MQPMMRRNPGGPFLYRMFIVIILTWGIALSACGGTPVPIEAPQELDMTTHDFLPYSDFVIGETLENEIDDTFGRGPDRHDALMVGSREYYQLCFYIESDLFLDCFVVDGEGVLQFLLVYLPEDSDITFDEVIENFGLAEDEKFTTFSAGSKMMIYGSEGYAFLVNPSTPGGGVVAFERFEPMDVKVYLELWGQDLLEENPYIK